MFSDPWLKTGARRLLRIALTAAWIVAAVPAIADGPPDFDGARALELVVAQCDLGPRTPGSGGNRLLQELIIRSAAEAGLTARRQPFVIDDPMGGGRLDACNIVVSTPSVGSDQRLWLGAHFDTRPISDHDPDPARRAEPILGANDGASGVAVLLHLIELMATNAPPVGVDLIFFDAEDSGRSGAPREFCLGSQELASSLQNFGNPLAGIQPRGMILLDMIGDRDLRVPMEGYSLRHAPGWTESVFARAAELGLPAFVPERGPSVFDDHVPFLFQGIPAVDLIDFDYPAWHTLADTPAACSAASLEQVGRLMVDLIYRP